MNVSVNASPLKGTMGCVPLEGPYSLTLDLDFTAGADLDVDLGPVQFRGEFSSVQAIYFNNSGNASVVTLTCNGTNQTMTIPPQCCGYVPVLVTGPAKFAFHSAGNVIVRIAFLNYYMPPFLWSAISIKGT